MCAITGDPPHSRRLPGRLPVQMRGSTLVDAVPKFVVSNINYHQLHQPIRKFLVSCKAVHLLPSSADAWGVCLQLSVYTANSRDNWLEEAAEVKWCGFASLNDKHVCHFQLSPFQDTYIAVKKKKAVFSTGEVAHSCC